MKILDWYILKRYLTTFIFTLLILIPIAVAIDIAEKVDKFINNDTLTLFEIVNDYYKNFIIYYANTFMPLALFIAVIIFTSRLSNNTEIIAINSSQISFTRFLYPYFLGATLVTIVALLMNHYVVPSSSKTRKKFENKYLKKASTEGNVRDFSLQLNDTTYIYIQNFDLKRNKGFNFSIDTYDGLLLKNKFTANNITWQQKDSTFRLLGWKERKVFKEQDSLFSGNRIDTTFAFSPKDLNYKSALAQEMPSGELSEFIDLSKKRGVKNFNVYLVELYKRTSLPIASYILTLIAVGLSYRKRRGGIGMNLALGLAIMFIYVFFLKVGEVLGGVATANSLLSVWTPNIVFGCYALYLYINGRK